MPSPLDGYEPKSWETHQLEALDGAQLPIVPTTDRYLECRSDSAEATRLAELDNYDPAGMFYFDFEQLAAGHNVHGVGPLGQLAQEWEGHPAGKLVFVSYEGMDQTPPVYTLFVEA